MSTHSQHHANAQRRHAIKKREKILQMMTDNKKKGTYLTPEPKDRNFGYPIDAPNAPGLVTAYTINNELFVNPMEMAEMEMDGLTFGGRNKRAKSGKSARSAKNVKRGTSYKRKSRRHKKNKNRSNKMSRKNKNRMSRKNKNRMSRKKKQL
jgi:hypothetical protein